MHLSYKTARYKDTVYKSYFIAESYREEGKVKKRIVWPLGRLTDTQAEQIRMICKTLTDPEYTVTSLDQITVTESKPFLDLQVAGSLWDEWRLSRAFTDSSQGELPTPLVAKILTINKCVAPCSHYSIPQWASKSSLSDVVGQSLEGLTDDKIYYELDLIDRNHEALEEHLFRATYSKDKDSYRRVNYDLSSSYFVGIKCPLSHCGHSKDHKPHKKQVLLAVMVNDRGYPFKWDVYPGNTAEVKTLTDKIDACRRRFGLRDVTLVFDRGIVSDENLEEIDDQGLKYVSALDKDQIVNVGAVDLDIFGDVDDSNFKERLPDWEVYDESLVFKDLGVHGGRRYIIGFNPHLRRDERSIRREKMETWERFLLTKNRELREATRSRNLDQTRQSILQELKRLKIKKYFHDPVLTEICRERTNRQGKTVSVKSFQVSVRKKTEQIALAERLDGLCLFVSNHTERQGESFLLPGREIICAYRDKTKIEDAFKHIKSFLKVRPFYVYLDSHVRAVYTICILAYFLNKDLAERRRRNEGVDYLNSKNLYEPFRNGDIVTLKDRLSGRLVRKPVELNLNQRKLLNKLEIKMPPQIM